MSKASENSKSQQRPIVAISFILAGVFYLAWSDVFERGPFMLSLSLGYIALIIYLGSQDRKRRRILDIERPTVPLDLTDRRAQLRFLGFFLLVFVSLINPSHEAAFISKEVVPEELQGYEESSNQDSRELSFVTAYEPRENAVKALPTTVNRSRTVIWALQLFVAFLTAAAVASWARHRNKVVRFACWIIFLHTILLSWIALHFKVEGVENVLDAFEAVNPRFYGPFRYNNFWTAWLVLSLGAGVALFSYYRQKEKKIGTFVTAAGLLSLIPPLLTAQSRGALVIVAIFAGLYLLPVIRRHPKLAHLSRTQLILRSLGVAAGVGLIAIVAITSTWDKWATEENAKAQKIPRMDDTIRQFSELREGRMPDLRIALARDGIKAGLMKPVFGWGLGSFEYAHPIVAGPEFMDDRNQHQTKFYGKMIRARHVHNDWVQIWIETGTVGLTLLIMMIWTFWKKHTFATRSSPMGTSLLNGCVCVAIFALWDFPFNNFAVQCLFAVSFGLAIAARRPSRSLYKAGIGAVDSQELEKSEG